MTNYLFYNVLLAMDGGFVYFLSDYWWTYLIIVILLLLALYTNIVTKRKVDETQVKLDEEREYNHKTESLRYKSVINGLAGDYEYVCFINPSTKEHLRYFISDRMNKYLKTIPNDPDITKKFDSFFKKYIYVADQWMFSEKVRLENVYHGLDDTDLYKVDFRLLLEDEPEYFSLRFCRDTNGTRNVIVGLISVDESKKIADGYISAQEEIQRMNLNEETLSVISGMADDYDGIIYVSIFEDKWKDKATIYRINEDFVRAIPEWDKEDRYHYRLGLIHDYVVHPDDRDRFLKDTRREVIIENTTKGSSYSVDFRAIINDTIKNYRMKFIPKFDENKNIIGFVVGLRNRDDAINLAFESSTYQNAILNNSVCYYRVNLTQNTLVAPLMVKRSGKPIDIISSVKQPLDRFDLIVTELAKSHIDPEDQEFFIKMMSPDYLISEYKKGNSVCEFVTRFHTDEYGWQYRRIVNYMNENSKTGDICTITVEYDYTSEMNAKKEADRQIDIVMSLVKNYSSVLCIDLKSNTVTDSYINDNTIFSNASLSNSSSFSDLAESFINNNVHPDDKSIVRDLYYGISEENDRDLYSAFFRCKYQDEYLYTEAHCAKKSDNTLVIAFTENDKAIKKDIDTDFQLKQNFNVINTLSSYYSAVFYFDISADICIPFTSDERIIGLSEQLTKSKINIFDGFIKMIGNFIYDLDRDYFEKEYNLKAIIEKLKDKKYLDVVFRINSENGPSFRKLTIVKADPEFEPATCISVGVSRYEEDALQKLYSEEYINDNIAVYYIDVIHNILKPIHRYKNHSYNENLSYSDAVNKFSSFISDESKNEWLKFADIDYLVDYLGEEEKREFVFKVIDDNDSYRSIEFNVIDRKDGKPAGFVFRIQKLQASVSENMSINNIIEEQKKTINIQQQLLNNVARNSDSAMKASSLSNISHDIRTPMNAIQGYTNLALTMIDNPDKIKGYLNKIATSADSLLSFVNNLFNVEDNESDFQNLDIHEYSIKDIMKSTYTLMINQAHSKNLKFYVDSYNIVNEKVFLDKDKLNLILINLITNAIKFTNPGGEVYVDVSETNINRDKSTFEFTVKDTGKGMSKNFVDKLFTTSLDDGKDDNLVLKNNGYGLVITKNIVDLMGGSIDVVSDIGKGTTFTVRLPLKVSANDEIVKISGPDEKRILIVEDSIKSCESITSIAERVGIDSSWSLFGKDALSKVRQAVEDNKPFNVVVIGNRLSDMRPSLLINQIKECSSENSVSFIVLRYENGYDEFHENVTNADFYINKPVFNSEIIEIVSKISKSNALNEPESGIDSENSNCKKILLVEDNEMDREIAAEILESQGFNVDTACDGFEAVEKVSKSIPGRYDIILMDVEMPKLNGYEATKYIRKLSDKDLANIPIIAMTACALDSDKREALAAGMDAHVSKPIDITKLKDTMNNYM